MNECNGHSKITQKYDSDWILLIPFDSTNQMIYLMKVVTCVTAKFCFGNQKESVIQLMIHSFMVNQITEWMILNWKQPKYELPRLIILFIAESAFYYRRWRWQRARNEGFLPANSVTNNVRPPAAAPTRVREQFHFLSSLRGKWHDITNSTKGLSINAVRDDDGGGLPFLRMNRKEM